MRKKSLTWTQKLSDQLNLAHIARKKMTKKKLKQTNASDHLIQYRFKQRAMHICCRALKTRWTRKP